MVQLEMRTEEAQAPMRTLEGEGGREGGREGGVNKSRGGKNTRKKKKKKRECGRR